MVPTRAALVAVIALAVAACEMPRQVEERPGEIGGAVLGGVAGGLAGAQIGGGTGRLVATAAGAVLGTWLGSQLGARLDEREAAQAEEATYAALENQESTSWKNPDTGNHGSVTPTRSYEREGRVCREFEHVVHIEGREQVATGTACRAPDGRWEIV